MEGLLCLLEGRLVQHDNSRKEVQEKLQETCSKTLREADSVEERIREEIRRDFEKKEEYVLSLVEKFNKAAEEANKGADLSDLVKEAQKELFVEQKYEIERVEKAECVGCSYELRITQTVAEDVCNLNGAAGSVERVVSALQKYLNDIHESSCAAQDRLNEVCTEMRGEAEKLEKRVNKRLEEVFLREDARIQEIVKVVKESSNSLANPDEMNSLIKRAKAALLSEQSYSLGSPSGERSLGSYDLIVTNEVTLECLDFERRNPTDLTASFTAQGDISLSFAFFGDDDEAEFLRKVDLSLGVVVDVWEKGRNNKCFSKTFLREWSFGDAKSVCLSDTFAPSTTYCVKMKLEHRNASTKWSECIELTTPGFEECCVWKRFPANVDASREFVVDARNLRVATLISEYDFCTITGSVSIPVATVTSWSIKVRESKYNNGGYIYVGVAPFDIDQNDDNHKKCGWYFDCYESALFSGPPHNYDCKKYGPRKDLGRYVHKGDFVGVVMDTTRSELSFVLKGTNLGVAYEGIPLNKLIVPCVILGFESDSVEFINNYL